MQVRQGDTVRIHFTGKLADGTVFDSSLGRPALEFRVGDGALIPAFEKAVVGMSPGDTKTASLRAEEAFGAWREELVMRLDPGMIPVEITPRVGQTLQLQNESGVQLDVMVAAVSDDEIVLDANHPLAGHDVTFDIQLMDIVVDRRPN